MLHRSAYPVEAPAEITHLPYTPIRVSPEIGRLQAASRLAERLHVELGELSAALRALADAFGDADAARKSEMVEESRIFERHGRLWLRLAHQSEADLLAAMEK